MNFDSLMHSICLCFFGSLLLYPYSLWHLDPQTVRLRYEPHGLGVLCHPIQSSIHPLISLKVRLLANLKQAGVGGGKSEAKRS